MSKRKHPHPHGEPERGRATADEPSVRRDDSGDGDDIEMVGFQAVDEAGVPLRGAEAVMEPEDEEIEVDDPITSDRRSGQESSGQADELRRRLAESEERVADLREQLLRAAADFENYRKRLERERKEERKSAATDIVRQLLPVLDNLGRAIDQARSSPESAALSGFVGGVALVDTQLRDVLKSAGLEPVDAAGRFDPSIHEAIMQEQTSSKPHLAILDVFEPGYLLNGRLLRPARVKVAFNPDERAADAAVASQKDDDAVTGD